MSNGSQDDLTQPDVGANNAQGRDLTGRTLGDFHLLRCLGQGGMGQVYLAEQISLKRKVAVKMLRGDLAASETALQRFEKEALAIAKATHANIVQVYFIGDQDGLHYMALEYVEGRNLREFIEKKGPPEILTAISIVRQTAAALERAGELGIVHRDIKPENILITPKGEVKVADFGLVHALTDDKQPLNLTQSGVALGTPLYMSPEQVQGKSLDPRTDIYSLGVTTYHLLAGQPPFRGSAAFEVAVQHVQQEPAPIFEIRPDLPGELCAIVHKMMAKDPDNRYQTAKEIIRDLGQLRDVLVGVSTAMPEVEWVMDSSATISMAPKNRATVSKLAITEPFVSPRRRWPAYLFAALTVVLMMAAGLGAGWSVIHLQRSAGDANSIRPEPTADKKVSPLEQEEQHLLKQFQRFANPNPKDPAEIQRGHNAATDLGLFYLKHQQYVKATKFFDQLIKTNKASQISFLGKLGMAMVLAFQDETRKSNMLFKRTLHSSLLRPAKGKRTPSLRARIAKNRLLANRHMREMLAQSLERNYVNDPKSFPKILNPLRSPPRPVTRKPQSGG